MSASNKLGDELVKLLESCVASVHGVEPGSGFFIDTDLLLTCAHVAGEKAASVDLTAQDGQQRRGTVIASSPVAEDDIAIVRLEPQPDGTPQRAMLLGASVPPGDAAFAPGYPTYQRADGSTGYGYRLIELTYDLGGDSELGTSQLQLSGEVPNGLSGAAVVSASTLAVVGVVRYRRPTAIGVTGGGAVAISDVVLRFPELARLVTTPPPSTFAWRHIIGMSEVAPDSRPCIEVSITGDDRRWRVDEAAQEASKDVTIAALDAEVGRAVFAWVSGRRPTSEEEVRWSGQLLGLALLAGSAGSKVREHHFYGESFDLRLSFNAAKELVDAPWELASVPGGTANEEHAGEDRDDIDPYLGARANTSLTRVDSSARPAQPASDRPVTVLAFVPREPVRIGAAADVSSLDKSAPRFAFTVERDDTYTEDLISRIHTASPTVVHYNGYIRQLRDGQPEFVIHTKNSDFMAVSDLTKECAAAGVRVLVVQCRALRPKREWGPPPPPSSYCNLLDQGLEALVFTQYAVSLKSLAAFNRGFYNELNAGARVEDAVQSTRSILRARYYRDEPSAFGAFVVVTGAQGGPRLVKPQDVATRTGHSFAREARTSGGRS